MSCNRYSMSLVRTLWGSIPDVTELCRYRCAIPISPDAKPSRLPLQPTTGCNAGMETPAPSCVRTYLSMRRTPGRRKPRFPPAWQLHWVRGHTCTDDASMARTLHVWVDPTQSRVWTFPVIENRRIQSILTRPSPLTAAMSVFTT